MNELDMKIVEEVRKEGREYLYKLSHPSYRNTCLKQNTWRDIGLIVSATPTEAMKRWRALRSRYVKLNKQLKSGGAAIAKNSRDESLIRELDFLKDDIIAEPTVSSFVSKVTRPTLFQDLFDSTADDIIEDFASSKFNIDSFIDETSPPAPLPEPPIQITSTSTPTTTITTQRIVEPTPGSSSSGETTSTVIPLQRSARQPPSKRKREPEDPNITKICDTIMQQQKLLQTLAQPAATAPPTPPPNTCMLRVFTEMWSRDFNKWPRSLQSGFIHKMTLAIEEQNDQIVTQIDNNFDFNI